jgi:histidyl-tRNA synthetase
VEERAVEVLTRSGFEEIQTPILEPLELFYRTIGESTDIVQKEMYTLKDFGGRELVLRPEGTAPVVRALLEGKRFSGKQERYFYRGPFFRYEQPQKGRLRQFHQIGAEIFSAEHPFVDGELIHIAYTLLQELRVTELDLHLNTLGCSRCRTTFRENLRDFFRGKSLCEWCEKRLSVNPLRILDCKEGCGKTDPPPPKMEEYLCPSCEEHWRGVLKVLQLYSVPFLVDPHLVRGLDYYTRTVFEFQIRGEFRQNTVLAGGRYDDLVSSLGGPSVPALGFALGVERVLLYGGPGDLPSSIVRGVIISLDEKGDEEIVPFLPLIRKEGYGVVPLFSRSLKSALRYADRWSSRWVLIRGEEERRKNTILFRDLITKDQQEIPFGIAEVLLFLRERNFTPLKEKSS